MARDLDAQGEAFRTRPLDAGPYTFATADALVILSRPVWTPGWHRNQVNTTSGR
jgi:hypothetical protein